MILFITIVVVAVLILTSVVVVILGRRRKIKKSLHSPYTEALNYMISGSRKEALEKLKEVVKEDTSNIDAYIKLGDLLREFNKFDQALKIHQSLTVRRNLKDFQKQEIYKSLVLDYQMLGNYSKAISILKKYLDIDKDDEWGKMILLKLYKQQNNWEEAFKLLKLLQKKGKFGNGHILALYRIQSGLESLKAGRFKESRIQFKKALKIDSNCAAAYYYIGKSYLDEGRKEDAINAWKNFVLLSPGPAHIVFNKLEEILFELGNFNEIENIYKSVLERDPENIQAMAALANIYEKKGEIDSAINLVETLLEKDPDSAIARTILIKLKSREDDRRGLEEQIDILLGSLKRPRRFHCFHCGYKDDEPLWICPECLTEESFFKSQ
ncbi:MAG: tetratricopeptide repeat protein [Fidelibacterota bacterium]